MKPIPLNALAKLMDTRHTNQNLVLGAAIDSRRVQPGDLFFALPGNRVDGHTFLKEVAEKGASAAVVEATYSGESYGLPLIPVPNVLTALQDLARKSLARRKSKVIGITGSLGKTTTKEFAATLLRARYHIFASPLSYNSQATLPLSILMADETEDFLILEMGMSQEGNIKNLISIAPPDIAILTTLAVQHASNFADGLAGIAKEKATIFSHPRTQLGFLHYDIQEYDEIYSTGACLKKSFSLGSSTADYFLETTTTGARIFSKGEASFEVPLQLPVPVHYQNFLAAAALARNLEIPWDLIQESVPLLKLPAMRFEPIEKKGILFINDAYNANPDAMKVALENLPKPKNKGRKIAVLGEMDALGMYSEVGHSLVAETALKYVDYLLCLGSRCEIIKKIWQKEGRDVELFETREKLGEALIQLAQPGDVILLKGARAQALDQLLKLFET